MGIELRGCCPLLQVFDMQVAVAFYRDVLGFEVVSQSRPGPEFDCCLLNRKGTELMLNTAFEREYRPASPDPSRIAAHGDTCIYFGWEGLDGLYAELRSKGVSAREPLVTPYGWKQLHVTDPDGFGLCFSSGR